MIVVHYRPPCIDNHCTVCMLGPYACWLWQTLQYNKSKHSCDELMRNVRWSTEWLQFVMIDLQRCTCQPYSSASGSRSEDLQLALSLNWGMRAAFCRRQLVSPTGHALLCSNVTLRCRASLRKSQLSTDDHGLVNNIYAVSTGLSFAFSLPRHPRAIVLFFEK